MNYYKVDAISYSSLLAISIGPQYYKNKQKQEQEDKEHFKIGSCVDCLLTEPELFDKNYYIEFSEKCEKVPTPQIKLYIDKIIEGYSEKEAYELANFKRVSDTLEAIRGKIANDYLEYFEWSQNRLKHIINNQGKEYLTQQQYELIKDIVHNLTNNRFTSKYFQNGFNVDSHTQVEIYWKFGDVACKSKFDKIIVNHNEKTIQPLDIKTTGKHISSFNRSFLQFRYDIQASFYSTALLWLIDKSDNEYWNKLKDYKILPFRFIVESTKYTGTPMVFNIPERMLLKSYEGFTYDKQNYKGWKELIQDLQWYKENNTWDYEREVVENDGELELIYE